MKTATDKSERSLICKAMPTAGFTLIEMLVIVVIIGVLVSLAVPAVMRAKGAGNIAQCAANLRSIGVGVQNYLSENNNTFPPEPTYMSLNGFLLKVMVGYYHDPVSGTENALNPQGRIVKSWICPSDRSRGGMVKYGAPNGVPGDEATNGINAHSYCANAYLFRRNVTEVTRQSQTILATDFPWGTNGTRAIYPAGSPWSTMYPRDWHQGKVNCLFVDGHVEPLAAKSLTWGQSNTKLWYVDYAAGVVGMKPVN